MEWIFNWLWVNNVPEETISWNDYFYIWMSNDYEYHLVIENWELRIYSYDYWSEDTILSDHQWEDWWQYLNRYFEWMYDCFAIDTMRYQILNIEWKAPFDIAKEIIDWADSSLADDLSCYLVQDNDRRDRVPSSNLLKFINRALKKIGTRTYCYYK